MFRKSPHSSRRYINFAFAGAPHPPLSPSLFVFPSTEQVSDLPPLVSLRVPPLLSPQRVLTALVWQTRPISSSPSFLDVRVPFGASIRRPVHTCVA